MGISLIGLALALAAFWAFLALGMAAIDFIFDLKEKYDFWAKMRKINKSVKNFENLRKSGII